MSCNPVIVIIVHKQFLSENEIKSLKQCYKILGAFDIRLVCPAGLDTSIYKQLIPAVKLDFIDSVWQSSYEMFNQLKHNIFLFQKYKHFSHILFYELDAWVFKDELEFWCKENFDYIGAPWFADYTNSESPIIGVGNGGFSLRSVQSSSRILKRINFLKKLRGFWYKAHIQSIFSFENAVKKFGFLFNLKSTENFEEFLLFKNGNEDFIWCVKIPQYFSDFRVAPADDALKFSFEVHPEKLYKANHFKLPFGCHAWWKYNLDFWKPFIFSPESACANSNHLD